MIKLNFSEPNDSDWLQWKNNCRAEADKLIQSYQIGHPIKITSLYSDQKDKFYGNPFYGKCAYCESNVEENSPTYVEHFRPKSGVRDINNNIIFILQDNTEIPHPGYYWLAYSWKNLLPTCWKCNTWHKDRGTGKMVGKGMRFPVANKHAETPDEEISELPELINPMWEDPKNHIHVDHLGIIHSESNSTRGETTIEIFGLNHREALVNGRKKQYENIQRKVKALLVLDDANVIKSELDDLKLIAKGNERFTIATKKAIADVLSSNQSISNLISTIL